MRLPLEIAMEVGSFLDRPSLTVCTTQLCWDGVGFVSPPCTDSAKVATIQLDDLFPLCCSTRSSHSLSLERDKPNGLVAIKRIDLWLARRTSAEKVVFVVDLKGFRHFRATMNNYNAVFSEIHRHYSLSSNVQFNNGPSLAVEWHARVGSISEVAFLLRGTNGGGLSDGCALASLDLSKTADEVNGFGFNAGIPSLASRFAPDLSELASCQALHTLNLKRTKVIDVSALASCQALHTLHLNNTKVSDVSGLASCQALHTLNLNGTQVSDMSALASCQALHTLFLENTQVSDVSALASCQALHTLNLKGTQVSDVSALVACGALRYLHGCEHMLGYGALARLLEGRM
jgi:hypothetical protein